MAARKSAKAWNKGMTGESKPAQYRAPVVDRCPTEDCGRPAEGDAPAAGWYRTDVPASSEPARDWCSTWCSAVGRALADLRRARR
ncbi:hypothetical protein [Streptomyces sp. SID3343]|uniref:hypothetical protein n=1 Tax=Streptomyces sp. SID3343 TaxID=2690260 RepID=UPI0013C12C70|nr:hypothetical protein [Streptomyces sp. SID3343]MYW03493.1 hypothetical protein [Streptomyces sp. SID3343]